MTSNLFILIIEQNNYLKYCIVFRVVFPLKLNLNSFISNNKNGIDKEEVLSEGLPEEMFGSSSKCDDSSYTGTDSSSALDEIDQVRLMKI